MSIRVKFLILSVIGVLVGFLIAQYVLITYVVYPRLALTEVGLADWGTRRVAELIQIELDRVDRLTSYAAAQPELATYLAAPNDHPWPSDLSSARLQVDRLNLVYLCDATGQVLRHAEINDDGSPVTTPPVLPQDALPANHPLLQPNLDGKEARGLLPTAWGLALVAARPVALPDQPDGTHGTLILGRWISEMEVLELTEKARKPSLLMPRINAEFIFGRNPEAEEREWATRNYTVVSGRGVSYNYVDLNDIAGRPILRLYADLEHPKYTEAGRIVQATRAAATIAVLFFLIASTYGLDRLLVRRVRHLSDDVRHLRKSGDIAGRVREQGRDELGHLADEINRLYTSLEAQTQDLRATAASLLENRGHLAAAEAMAHIGHFAWDIAANSLYHSDELHAICGTADDDFTAGGAPALMARIHPEDRDSVIERITNSLSVAGAVPHEFRVIRKEGGQRDVRVWIDLQQNSDGTPVRMVGMVQDITERKAAEAERTLLVTAIEQAAESIIVTDTHHKIVYVNPAFTLITGYTSEEVVGRTPRILHSGRQGAGFYREMHETLTRGEAWSGHLTNRRKDGTVCEGEATIAPVRDPLGRIIRYVNVTRDTSEEYRLEAQLRQSQKMEAMGTLAGGIAHDFNNILTGVCGFAQLAREDVPDGSEVASYLDDVLRGADRARELVSQILLFSRQSPAEARPMELNPIIEEVLSLLRAALPSTIEIRPTLPPQRVLIKADPTSMHQVLMNLCTNASHAMDGRGVLEITLEEMELDAAFCREHRNLQPGRYARIAVTDDGCGMDRPTMNKIFDPYFTTKGRGKGTGLGLAVVHGIIGNQGGDIQVYSEIGLGTTFYVYLPTTTARAQESKTKGSVTRVGGSQTILLAEDEDGVRHLVRTALGRMGYAVDAFATATAALEQIMARPERYDLILTDMTMPGITGLELAQQLRSICPQVPIVLWTGLRTTVDADAARRAGIVQILEKPLSINQLADTVQKVIQASTRGTAVISIDTTTAG